MWLGIGAVGGVLAYRRGQRAWDDARAKGLVNTSAIVTSIATSTVQQLRQAINEPGPGAAQQSLPVGQPYVADGQQVVTLPVEFFRQAGMPLAAAAPQVEVEDEEAALRRQRSARKSRQRRLLQRSSA